MIGYVDLSLPGFTTYDQSENGLVSLTESNHYITHQDILINRALLPTLCRTKHPQMQSILHEQ